MGEVLADAAPFGECDLDRGVHLGDSGFIFEGIVDAALQGLEGGQRIAFSVAGSGHPTRWLALDRSGQTTELPAAPLVGTPDGYLSLDTPYGGAMTSLYHVGSDGQATQLWQDSYQYWQLAGHSPLPAPDEPLPPFPAIASVH